MATKITKNIQNLIAKSFLNYLKNAGNDHTYYVGLSYFSDSDYEQHAGTADSDSVFIGGLEGDSEVYDQGDFEAYLKNTTSIHKVFPGGVSRVVPRIDWTEGEVYEGWTPISSKHYVLVREFYNGVSRINVYKCLYSPNTPSLQAPQGALPLPFKTIDNYWWMYMYTISNSEALRFLTPNWMPCPEKVENSEIANLQQGTNKYYQYIQQVSAVKGSIYNVLIDSDAANAQFSTFKAGLKKRVIAYNTDVFAVDSDRFQADIVWDSENDTLFMELATPGSGYSSNIEFRDDSDREIKWLSPFVAPGQGHGADAPTELGAKYLMVSTRVTPSDKILYLMTGRFKMVNLIQNPIDQATNGIATNDYYFACRSLLTDANNEYSIGDVLKSRFNDDGRRLRVVGKNDRVIYYTDITPKELNLSGFIAEGELVSDITETKFATVKANYDRDVYYTFDEIVLVDVLETPIKREADQIESINLIFRF